MFYVVTFDNLVVAFDFRFQFQKMEVEVEVEVKGGYTCMTSCELILWTHLPTQVRDCLIIVCYGYISL